MNYAINFVLKLMRQEKNYCLTMYSKDDTRVDIEKLVYILNKVHFVVRLKIFS